MTVIGISPTPSKTLLSTAGFSTWIQSQTYVSGSTMPWAVVYSSRKQPSRQMYLQQIHNNGGHQPGGMQLCSAAEHSAFIKILMPSIV